ncbi:MAG TPA: TIGR03619 family F420-dependent LLM class oxidoreductase [Mycobacteriales bacterium]
MKLGVGLPMTGAWATPEAMLAVGTTAETLGYSSLWTYQRLLHPVDEEWGSPYHSVLDPVVALSYVAAATTSVRLGLAILNMPYYSPIVLSKALTTLDRLSAGRLDVGLGLGWAPPEFDAAGAPYERRGARGEEFIHCLQAIWTEPVVEFDGEFYRVPRSRVDPKPLQKPTPPLLLGGMAEKALRRAGRIADGWISSSRADLSKMGSSIEIVRAAATEAGRDPERLRFVVRGVVRLVDEPMADDRKPLQGDAAQIRSDLERLSGVGVTEVFLDLNYDERTAADDVDAEAGLANAMKTITTLAPG